MELGILILLYKLSTSVRSFGAEQHHYALLKSVLKGLQCFSLLVVVPWFLRKGIHETIVCGTTTMM